MSASWQSAARAPAPMCDVPSRQDDHGVAPPAARSGVERLEDCCRGFLELSHERDLDNLQVTSWFRQHECQVSIVVPLGSSWGLLSVNLTKSGSPVGQALIVPAMGRAMGQVPLDEYYELANYNGLDPLTPRNVREFSRLLPLSQKVARKGLIDGR